MMPDFMKKPQPANQPANRSVQSASQPVQPTIQPAQPKPTHLSAMPDTVASPGSDRFSPAKQLGDLLRAEMKADPTLYLFSPDETTSNKLDAPYKEQARAWVMPTKAWDLPESASGRIVELLSENVLFSTMVGHVLGSREPAFMTSYEAFFEIVAAQILQHLKFLKQVDESPWRKKQPISQLPTTSPTSSTSPAFVPSTSPAFVPSTPPPVQTADFFPALNLLSTSTCWRQDHNGFSHQSPALISTLLDVPSNYVNCLFPVDDVAATAAFDFMLASHNVVNLTTFNKTDEPRWIDKNHAAFQLENGGASIFGFASDGDESLAGASLNRPDVIFTAAGDIVTRETLAAIRMLREDTLGFKFRFVGVAALTHGAIGTTKNRLSQDIFDQYFGQTGPIIANFHGYADTFRQILGNYTDIRRVHAHGFSEQGSTTTPLEMLTLNGASRFDIAADAAEAINRPDLAMKYRGQASANREFAREVGLDSIEL